MRLCANRYCGHASSRGNADDLRFGSSEATWALLTVAGANVPAPSRVAKTMTTVNSTPPTTPNPTA